MQHSISNEGHVRGRWRRRIHHTALLVASVFLASVALNWAWAHIQALAPTLPEMRFVDTFALVVAACLLAFAVSSAWHAATTWQLHDPGETN